VSGRTAVVTGSTGFLGLNLVEELLERGWRVVALHREGSPVERLDDRGVEAAQADLLDPGALRAAIPERADALFHVAGDTSMWARHRRRQERINVEGTRNVVRAALERGVGRLVHTSTVAVFGPCSEVVTEDMPHGGAESWIGYLRTKALAEREVRAGIAEGLDAVILNPANIVGRYDTRNWGRLFLMMERGALPGAPPGEGSFAHARAVARAHVEAWHRGRTGENYLLGGVDATYHEVTERIGAMVGHDRSLRVVPCWILALMGRVSAWAALATGREPDMTPEAVALVCARMVCSSRKAMQELDYRPVPLDTMLVDCHAWLLEQGLLGRRKKV